MPDSSSNIKQEKEPILNDSEQRDKDLNQVKNGQAEILTEINQPNVNTKLILGKDFKISKQRNSKEFECEKENVIILNRKQLSELTLTKKLAELQNLRLEMGKYGQNINCCEEKKLCSTLNLFLNQNVLKRELVAPINSTTKCEVVGSTDYEKNPCYTPTNQNSGIREHESTAGVDNTAEKELKRLPDEGTAPDSEPTQRPVSEGQEQEGDDQGGLVLRKWKNKCKEYICEIRSLLDVCENNPDYVLSSLKGIGENKKVPGSVEIVNENRQSYHLKYILGEKFGDPKYHLLMVDSSTSISSMDFTNTDFKTNAPETESISSKAQQSVVIIEPITIIPIPNEAPKSDTIIESELPDDIDLEFKILQELQRSIPEKKLYEVEDKAPKVKRGSILSREVSTGDTEVGEKGSSVLSWQLDSTPRDTKVEEKVVSTPGDTVVEEKVSGAISWHIVSTPSESESTASLNEVVKNATAKAEHFRQNVDSTKQQGLVDISTKGNDMNNKKEDNTTISLPPKKKKLFNFRCFKKKK